MGDPQAGSDREVIRADRREYLSLAGPDGLAGEHVIELHQRAGGREGPPTHGGGVPDRDAADGAGHVEVPGDHGGHHAHRQVLRQPHELQRAEETVGQVSVGDPQGFPGGRGDGDDLGRATELVAQDPAEVHHFVTGHRQRGEQREAPPAAAVVGRDAQASQMGVGQQVGTDDPGAERPRRLGDRIRLPGRPPGLLQHDHVGPQLTARGHHVERRAVGLAAAMQVQAGKDHARPPLVPASGIACLPLTLGRW